MHCLVMCLEIGLAIEFGIANFALENLLVTAVFGLDSEIGPVITLRMSQSQMILQRLPGIKVARARSESVV